MSARSTKTEAAAAFIKRVLRQGPIPSKQLFDEAASSGINRYTLEKVKKTLTTTFQRDRSFWVELATESIGSRSPLSPLPLFEQPTIPLWLTPSETINWLENDPFCGPSSTASRLIEIYEQAVDAQQVIFDNLIDDVFAAIETLKEDKNCSSTDQLLDALAQRLGLIYEAGPDDSRRE